MTPPPGRRAPRPALLTLYAHPFELAALILLGVSAVSTGIEPAALTGILSEGLVYVWAIANAVGVLATIAGLFLSADVTGNNPRRTSIGRGIEKAGLYLIAGTMGTYVIVLEAALPWRQSWSVSAQLLALGAAAALRAGAIRKAEKIELEQVRRLSASEVIARIVEQQQDPGGEHPRRRRTDHPERGER